MTCKECNDTGRTKETWTGISHEIDMDVYCYCDVGNQLEDKETGSHKYNPKKVPCPKCHGWGFNLGGVVRKYCDCPAAIEAKKKELSYNQRCIVAAADDIVRLMNELATKLLESKKKWKEVPDIRKQIKDMKAAAKAIGIAHWDPDPKKWTKSQTAVYLKKAKVPRAKS